MSVSKTLSAVLLLVGVAQSGVTPSFRFAYQNPGEPSGIAQFYNGPDQAFQYNWGYQFPGRAHSESKTYDGTVKGSYAFVDAHGDVQQATYQASPGVGFNVDQKIVAKVDGSVVAAPAAVVPGAADVYPLQYTPLQFDVNQFRQEGLTNNIHQIGLDSGSVQAIEKASPSLMVAVRSGFLEPLMGDRDQIVFKVADALVDRAQGSVSALATLLDADVPAARHDQQVYRGPTSSFYSASETSPSADRAILEIGPSDSGKPGYIVRIPYRI